MSFGEVIGWLVLLVVASLIVSFIIDPSIMTDIKNRLPSFSSLPQPSNFLTDDNDTLMSDCISSFNECKERTEIKYGISIRTIKAEKFHNHTEADVFFQDWKGVLQTNLRQGFILMDEEEEYPLVLIATTLMGGEGGQNPTVVICNKEGELTKYSEMDLWC